MMALEGFTEESQELLQTVKGTSKGDKVEAGVHLEIIQGGAE